VREHAQLPGVEDEITGDQQVPEVEGAGVELPACGRQGVVVVGGTACRGVTRQQEPGFLEALPQRRDPKGEAAPGDPLLDARVPVVVAPSPGSTAPPGNTVAPGPKTAPRVRSSMKTCRSGRSETRMTVAASRVVGATESAFDSAPTALIHTVYVALRARSRAR
jgi:hypothetical protein